jgi:hypothetical protein
MIEELTYPIRSTFFWISVIIESKRVLTKPIWTSAANQNAGFMPNRNWANMNAAKSSDIIL